MVRTQREDLRNACICIAIVAAAMVLVWPFADMPLADDWAYTHTTLELVRTGRFIYNGNESAMLVLHAYWGALFIRLFGFSFNCMRFSTAPFALGAVGLCYFVVRRTGLTSPAAVFVTLLFGLSPEFLPVAVSYMTDALSLFFLFFSVYSLSRAAEACAPTEQGPTAEMSASKAAETKTNPGASAWLALGVLTALIGGSGRQVVWLVPLVVLPYLIWLRRRRLWFAVAASVGWIVVFGVAAAMTKWFNRQPYAVPDPGIIKQLKLALGMPLFEINISARMALTTLLLVLPAALPLLLSASIATRKGSRGRRIIVAVLSLGLLAAVLIHPSLASMPWMGSTLNWEGIHGTMELPGRPVVLVRPVRAFIAVPVYAAAILLAGEVWERRRSARGILMFFRDPPVEQLTLATFSFFGAVYFILLILRAAYIDLFDRYLLPFIPWIAALLLNWNKAGTRGEWALRRAMPAAWTLLAVYAFYAVASTQDVLALARARATAAARLEAAGVPRTAIDAGYEYNGWTELLVSGHVNLRWVVNPPGAYRPGLGVTPSVKPVYRLEYAPVGESAATRFGSVSYVSLLPPFRKQVCIDRVVHPSP